MTTDTCTQLLQRLDREIWLLTAATAAHRGGLIATFVCNASIVPALPRVLVGIAKHHFTWELIEASGEFALHLLAEDQLELVWHFGLQSGRGGDKLAGFKVEAGMTSSPLLSECPGWLECRVEARFDIGDRTLFLAEVVHGRVEGDETILRLHRLVQLAPTDKLSQLRNALARDATVDAEAIEAWRKSNSRS